MERMKLLRDVDGDEVSLVRRAANKRRFLLLKGDSGVDAELTDILEVPCENEGALLDTLRKGGVEDETVEKAAVAALRLLKGVESEFSPEIVEKLSALYGLANPKLNTSSGSAQGDLDGTGSGSEQSGSGSSDDDLDGHGRDGELSGTGSGKKVAGHAVDCDCAECNDGDADDVGKSDEQTTEEERGTVEVQVPVRKEDGTWDFSGVPETSRSFFQEMVEKADRTESELKEAREKLAKADDTLRHREMIQKAAKFSHVAPTDDLAPILKEASEKLEPESFEKLENLLKSAEERIVKGDLFVEKGRTFVNDGTDKSDAWTTAVKKADEMIEKSGVQLSQDQALAKVWESNPDLYGQYLAESGMGGI